MPPLYPIPHPMPHILFHSLAVSHPMAPVFPTAPLLYLSCIFCCTPCPSATTQHSLAIPHQPVPCSIPSYGMGKSSWGLQGVDFIRGKAGRGRPGEQRWDEPSPWCMAAWDGTCGACLWRRRDQHGRRTGSSCPPAPRCPHTVPLPGQLRDRGSHLVTRSTGIPLGSPRSPPGCRMVKL